MLKKTIAFVIAAIAGLVLVGIDHGAKADGDRFKGVVTYHLIPAKMMRVNEIVEDPQPGSSYIGDKGMLFEIDQNMDLRANWTIVQVQYHEYQEPKTIQYELFGEKHEVAVHYRAINVIVDGNISDYIQE